MKNECNNIHLPNYKNACCLRHLIEMSKYADMQTLTKKYSKFLLITLNHNSRGDRLQYSTIKLDLFLSFIDVLTKYMAHFFLINKPIYANILGSIAMKAFKETAFKEHPEVILRIIAIHNNISCIYEAKGNYDKAYKYLIKNKQYIELSSPLDNAILYNNLIRICFKLNKIEEIDQLIQPFKEALDEEIKTAKSVCMKQAIESSLSTNSFYGGGNNGGLLNQKEMIEKNQLIAFLLLNLSTGLERFGLLNETKELIKKGYEFSMSVLGEVHLYTHQFLKRLNILRSMHYMEDSESNEMDYRTAIDKMKFHKGNKSFDSVMKYQIEQREKESNINDEYKKKLDFIYDYIVTQNKGVSKHTTAEKFQKHSQSETEPSLSNIKPKEKKAYLRFKNLLKPFLRKCIENFAKGDFGQKANVKKDQKAMIEEMLQEAQITAPRTKGDKTPTNTQIKKQQPQQQQAKPQAQPQQQQTIINNNPNTPYKTPKVKALFERVLGTSRYPSTKQGAFSNLISALVNNDDDEISMPKQKTPIQPINEVCSPTNKTYKKNKSLIDGLNNHNDHTSLSTRNMIKPELESEMKQIRFDIAYDEDKDEPFEFKPFYQSNEKYEQEERTHSVVQKIAKFVKKSNQIPGEHHLIDDIIKGKPIMPPNPNSQLPSIVTHEEAETTFEFVPYYNKSTTATHSSDTVVEQKKVKILRKKEEDTSMTGFLQQNHNTNSHKESSDELTEVSFSVPIVCEVKASPFEFKPFYYQNEKYKDEPNKSTVVHQKKKIFCNKEGNISFPKMIIAKDNDEHEYEFVPFYVKNKTNDDKDSNNLPSQKKVVFYRNKGEMDTNSNMDIANLSKQKLPFIQLDINQEDEPSYEFIPFYVKDKNAVTNLNNSQHSLEQSEHKKVKFVSYKNDEGDDIDISIGKKINTKDSSSSLDIEIASQPSLTRVNLMFNNECLIEKEEHISYVDYLNTKTKSTINTSAFFDKLPKNSSNQSILCISTLALFQNEYYKIIITQSSNSSLVLRLYNPQNPTTTLSELTINMNKLKEIIQKSYLFYVLPKYIDLEQIISFEQLIENILLHHCNIIKKESKFSIGICAKPNSICGEKQILFKYLKVSCIIDLLIIQRNVLRIIVTNSKNMDSSFSIDCFCDDSSFNDLVTEIPNQLPIKLDEIYLSSYKFHDRHMTKNGFIQCLMKRTQEIIQLKTNDKEITMNSIQSDLHTYFFQCEVKDKCSHVTFKDIKYDSFKNNFAINTYSFPVSSNKDESMSSNSITLTIKDYDSLFNCNSNASEFIQMYKLFNERDRIITHYLILNAIHLPTVNKIIPTSLFDHRTIIDTSIQSFVHCQLVTYSNDFYFGKIVYYNPIVNYEYSLILLPKKDVSYKTYQSILKTHRKKLDKIIREILKEYIQCENCPLKKYYPMSILIDQ